MSAPEQNGSGVFHAVPVRVDSTGSEDSDQDEEEEEDEEDAQTVIFKSSPFSSPGRTNFDADTSVADPVPL